MPWSMSPDARDTLWQKRKISFETCDAGSRRNASVPKGKPIYPEFDVCQKSLWQQLTND